MITTCPRTGLVGSSGLLALIVVGSCTACTGSSPVDAEEPGTSGAAAESSSPAAGPVGDDQREFLELWNASTRLATADLFDMTMLRKEIVVGEFFDVLDGLELPGRRLTDWVAQVDEVPSREEVVLSYAVFEDYPEDAPEGAPHGCIRFDLTSGTGAIEGTASLEIGDWARFSGEVVQLVHSPGSRGLWPGYTDASSLTTDNPGALDDVVLKLAGGNPCLLVRDATWERIDP